MKRECVAAEVSVAIEPKMELEEISTSVVGLKFSIEFRPQVTLSGHRSDACSYSRPNQDALFSHVADAISVLVGEN